MKFLLDTCVISELIKPNPNANVVAWVSENNEDSMYLSVLTFGEIAKGIEKAPSATKKKALQSWVENDLKERFKHKIIDLDMTVATTWGQMQGKAELAGKPMPTIDGLIAATGIAYDCIVVTRNISDMEQSGVDLVNPWE